MHERVKLALDPESVMAGRGMTEIYKFYIINSTTYYKIKHEAEYIAEYGPRPIRCGGIIVPYRKKLGHNWSPIKNTKKKCPGRHTRAREFAKELELAAEAKAAAYAKAAAEAKAAGGHTYWRWCLSQVRINSCETTKFLIL